MTQAHIAIIGTEGSGKTILATVWAHQLTYSRDRRLRLIGKNIDTERYVDQLWRQLNQEKWLPSNPQGTKTELEWKLQLGDDFEYPIKLLDMPGQDLRNFFNGNYNSLGRDASELGDYIKTASTVVVVVNLERILNETQFARTQTEDNIVIREIARYLAENADTQHICFVFTAWDKVAPAILDEYRSLTNYIQQKLTPFYNICEDATEQEGKGIYFLAVAAVAQTKYAGYTKEIVPKENFRSYNLGNLTKILVQSLAAQQNKAEEPEWNEDIVHPYDEELLDEWRLNGWREPAKAKPLWNPLDIFKPKPKTETDSTSPSQTGTPTPFPGSNAPLEAIQAWLSAWIVMSGRECRNTFTQKYAQFTGRARRREYFSFAIPTLLLTIVLFGLQGFSAIAVICGMVIAIPHMAVAARRMHDIGQSGWWIMIYLIPYIGWLIFLIIACRDGQSHSNKYGPNPKDDPQTLVF